MGCRGRTNRGKKRRINRKPPWWKGADRQVKKTTKGVDPTSRPFPKDSWERRLEGGGVTAGRKNGKWNRYLLHPAQGVKTGGRPSTIAIPLTGWVCTEQAKKKEMDISGAKRRTSGEAEPFATTEG